MARVMAWYAAAVVLLAAAYVAIPGARGVVLGVVGVLGVVAVEAGVRHFRPPRASAWRVLAGALVLLGLSDIIFVTTEAGSATQVSYPATSDVVTLPGYIVFAVALFWLGRPSAPNRDETSLIDAISLTLAASLIVWITVVRPTVESQHLSTFGRLVAVGSLLGYTAVLAAAVRLALGWRRNASVVLLGLALVGFLYQELNHAQFIVRADWPSTGRIDFSFLVLASLCGAAALNRSMCDVASPAYARHSIGPWRLVVIAIGMLVAPLALVIERSRGNISSPYEIAAVAALVSVLVLVRLSMSARAYQGRAAREHAARVASQAMVSAVTAEDVVAGTRDALRPLSSRPPGIDVTLTERPGQERPAKQVVTTGPDGIGELVVPLTGSDMALVFAAPTRQLADLADLLRSLADQAAVAIQRINLAEAARAEERERYFRTLVTTSTDAILISRNGIIEYATPSAESFFGRNVLGECFDDLVSPTDPDQVGRPWPDVVAGLEGVIHRPDGDISVVIQRRNLTGDATVRGIVTTLRDVTAERELQRDLAYRATHDELTGMVNARAWGETLNSETERRRGPGDAVAVIFIDIDDFKTINDQYGHPTGDQVLAEMSRRIRECLRSGDIAARVGGDEFAVLLHDLPNADDARVVAQRLAEALSRPATVDNLTIEVKASIGLSYSEGQERIESLVRQADTALYAAKEQGKGRWTEYNGRQWAPSGRKVNDGSAEPAGSGGRGSEPAGSGGRGSEPAGSGGRGSEPAGSGGRGSGSTERASP